MGEKAYEKNYKKKHFNIYFAMINFKLQSPNHFLIKPTTTKKIRLNFSNVIRKNKI